MAWGDVRVTVSQSHKRPKGHVTWLLRTTVCCNCLGLEPHWSHWFLGISRFRPENQLTQGPSPLGSPQALGETLTAKLSHLQPHSGCQASGVFGSCTPWWQCSRRLHLASGQLPLWSQLDPQSPVWKHGLIRGHVPIACWPKIFSSGIQHHPGARGHLEKNSQSPHMLHSLFSPCDSAQLPTFPSSLWSGHATVCSFLTLWLSMRFQEI